MRDMEKDMENSKFEIRNSKDLAREARVIRILRKGASLNPFEFSALFRALRSCGASVRN
jgi:hypothetical protein